LFLIQLRQSFRQSARRSNASLRGSHVSLAVTRMLTYVGGESNFSAIGRGRPISDNPLQDAGLSTARGMIKNCLSSHSRCRQLKPTTLPKRVLDLLLGPDAKSVVLHESEWNDDEQRYEHGEYVALSHVWGIGKGPKTTKDNLQSHVKGIAWSTLPRAFQEAVEFTRALGIRYLWIDSLCLLQDDVQAKLEESVRMDEIFGNAFLAIAATSATDSSSQPMFPAKTQPFKIQATDNKGQLSKVYVREQPSHYSFKAPFDEGSHMNEWELPFNISEEANLHTPLLKRAWAYTERLLSPRVLHFTKSEMILECREGYSCECGRIDDTTFDSRTTDSIKQEFGRLIGEASTRPHTNGNSNPLDRRIDGNYLIRDSAQTRRRPAAMELYHHRVHCAAHDLRRTSNRHSRHSQKPTTINAIWLHSRPMDLQYTEFALVSQRQYKMPASKSHGRAKHTQLVVGILRRLTYILRQCLGYGSGLSSFVWTQRKACVCMVADSGRTIELVSCDGDRGYPPRILIIFTADLYSRQERYYRRVYSGHCTAARRGHFAGW
jgi:hypothetical protein